MSPPGPGAGPGPTAPTDPVPARPAPTTGAATHRAPAPGAPTHPVPVPTVPAHAVLAEDAPGPTLVIRVGQLPAGALASSAELAGLRAALARTPYAGLGKIALYGPSGRADPDAEGDANLDYRFVQALPDGRFDFRTGCGHSLLACVVAGAATTGGPARPVTVRAVTTGDTVRCTPEGDGAYTLAFLRPPAAPGTLPTGRPVDVLDGVPVTLIRYGNPYVLVDARHVPAPVPEGPLQGRLLELRAHAARLLGHPPHSPLPKIAVFTRTSATGAGSTLAARALTVGGWHPRLALTGAAAFAAAGAIDGTVLAGPVTRIRTPGGTVTVSAEADRVRVHHKRARVLGRLQLPWRIHATA
ncbi:hypothetical protein ABZV60_18030 [Streptomyces sp. NPDC004787]|uniref:PrpF domain-containing protein n=1 Tax=Streptomyces sp. NPDC004787 TaxID=3154291 RepID=UPI0033B63B22